jgi:hypothetical protein
VLLCQPVFASIESPHRRLWLGCQIADLQPVTDVETKSLCEECAESIDSPQPWCRDICDVFVDLRYLARIQLQKLDNLWHSDWIYSIKRKLVSLSNTVGDQHAQNMRVQASCCTAALILIEVCFRGIGLATRIIERFVKRARAIIEPVVTNVLLILTSPAIARPLLWAIYISGTAAKRPERQWFVAQIVWLCSCLDINHWKDMEAFLEGILWQRGWEIPYMALWDEVQIARVKLHDVAIASTSHAVRQS